MLPRLRPLTGQPPLKGQSEQETMPLVPSFEDFVAICMHEIASLGDFLNQAQPTWQTHPLLANTTILILAAAIASLENS